METIRRGDATLPPVVPVVRHDPSMDQHSSERLGHHVVSAEARPNSDVWV